MTDDYWTISSLWVKFCFHFFSSYKFISLSLWNFQKFAPCDRSRYGGTHVEQQQQRPDADTPRSFTPQHLDPPAGPPPCSSARGRRGSPLGEHGSMEDVCLYLYPWRVGGPRWAASPSSSRTNCFRGDCPRTRCSQCVLPSGGAPPPVCLSSCLSVWRRGGSEEKTRPEAINRESHLGHEEPSSSSTLWLITLKVLLSITCYG